jgi:hypothetical protein
MENERRRLLWKWTGVFPSAYVVKQDKTAEARSADGKDKNAHKILVLMPKETDHF